MYTEKEQTTSTEAILAGAAGLAGATIGIIAGPAGVVAGAIIGSIVGAAAGVMVTDSNNRRWHHDEETDYDIGVYDGTIGAASPDAPPTRIGAFSAGSAGAAGNTPSTPPPNEGPMQEIEG
jgi:phage tail tape-measure protein